ncbi:MULTISPECIES: adenylosuccinate synthase [Robiginitalea]|uniref:Adenylosuccinate synthetase n=1 Tax=Robiginitalea biformata (strain ATCC BAA-864 / DSM 15991 / KCTC 12146 / HTCC2501) TaxID=313596 RepID=A4CQ32_ROBBH|nr:MULTISPECIES: adenylosuccinate synthase [Robiginitalea]EAR14117.1 adenylosuccinate synthetase [Robiginitalea biformata HTCC2501]MDC6354789.1 adenylosuccinate synthase [Robiginitalea sp. PM2]MDC6375055.1 adenylosuccinate synthase [Robiginitalea sp. SP8]
MPVDLLLGLQWGDEGKGKIVDVLTADYDIIARFQGGPNAGHTLEFDGIKHVLHTIPSGIFHPKAVNVVGNGVVIDPVIFRGELEKLADFPVDPVKSLLISRKAHLILPTHRLLDAASEAAKGKAKIGSTLKGIGPAYMDKTGRNGLRVGDLELPDWRDKYRALADKHEAMIHFYDVDIQYNLQELEADFLQAVESLRKLTFIDSEEYLFQALDSGKRILAEGAQGSLLDIDFGTYPYVTSSNTTAAGACTGLGIAPGTIGDVFGIFKAYTTRVGSGPFPTELFDQDGETMGRVGNEFGATTGRARRCGWLDLVALKYAVRINGVTQLMMMKADVLSGFETIKVCTAYKYKGETIDHLPYTLEAEHLTPVYTEMPGWKEDLTAMGSASELPEALNDYIAFLEDALQTPIKIVSVGPDRVQTIRR